MRWDALSNFVFRPFDNMHLAMWTMGQLPYATFRPSQSLDGRKISPWTIQLPTCFGCFLVLVPFNLKPQIISFQKDIHPSARFHPVGRSDPIWILKKIIHEKKMDIILHTVRNYMGKRRNKKRHTPLKKKRIIHDKQKKTSWEVEPTHLKTMLVKLDHFPKFSGRKQKVWNHHLEDGLSHQMSHRNSDSTLYIGQDYQVVSNLHRSESRWLATPKRWRIVRGHEKPRQMGVAIWLSIYFPGSIEIIENSP